MHPYPPLPPTDFRVFDGYSATESLSLQYDRTIPEKLKDQAREYDRVVAIRATLTATADAGLMPVLEYVEALS